MECSVEEDPYKPYSLEEINEILQIMQIIKSSIPPNATEFERFMAVYKAIGISVDYDMSGVPGNEDFSTKRHCLTRSLKGVLLEGRAVCAGYALALKHVLNYIGIEARTISGNVCGDYARGHQWNQVRIDGQWYNTDLTWDYKEIRKGEELVYCLRCDEEFCEYHTEENEIRYRAHNRHAPTYNVEICDKDFSREEIKHALESMYSEYDANQKNYGRGFSNLVGLQSYRKLAHTTEIQPTLITDIKDAVEGKEDSQSGQEPEQ